MRIAITSLYLPGSSKIGTGYQVHDYANQLIDRGDDVTVFSPDQPGDDSRYEYVRVDPGPSMRTFRFAWRLRGVDLADFDILHGHGDDCFLTDRHRPPHVRTVHGSCFSEARRVPGAKSKARMGLLGIGEVASTILADRAYGVSRATRRVYPWLDGVIPCGVDLGRFGGDRSPTSDPTILFVGTYQNRKRGRLLMEAFEETVRPRIPEARLRMVCSDAPSAPGVDILGRVGDDELAALYRSSWAFCLPSSYEGFGVPYIEALAAGCPVVATPNPGAREVLDEGRFGVLAEPDALGEALVDLLQDRTHRDMLEVAGRTRAQEFSWDRVVGDYRTVYTELLDRPPRRRRNA
jgi:phosphatidylinositol alpha-mannosyltransferase